MYNYIKHCTLLMRIFAVGHICRNNEYIGTFTQLAKKAAERRGSIQGQPLCRTHRKERVNFQGLARTATQLRD